MIITKVFMAYADTKSPESDFSGEMAVENTKSITPFSDLLDVLLERGEMFDIKITCGSEYWYLLAV